MSKRDKQIIKAINDDGFEFKGIHYKPFSLRTLSLMEEIESPFVVGGSQTRAMLDYLFISANDTKTIRKAINEGWDDAIMDYGESFGIEDLAEIAKIVQDKISDAVSTIVEIREESEKKQ